MKTREFALTALFIAVVCVATMVVRIPIPQTNGYMNLGDSMVLLAAVVFAPWQAFMVGGVGSALADLFGGYPQWAVWTLIIKGFEALLAGGLLRFFKLSTQRVSLTQILVFALATAWMVLGYFAAETVMYDSKAALAELPANIVQATGSVILATFLMPVMQRILGLRPAG
jgi:uncharacterized membrane protein